MKIMFSAGDPSGDRHGADIIKRLKDRFPDAEITGLGGQLMTHAGFTSFLPFDKMNVMGLFEVLRHIPFLLKCKNSFIERIQKEKPDALVCIDYSGFNMPLAKAAKKLDIPVIWYIAPKFWGWKRKKYTDFLKTYVDKVAVIFPFVTKSYGDTSDNMEFVGNPLVEQNRDAGYDIERDENVDLKSGDSIRIALTPGSRRSEIVNMLPVMIEACNRLKETYSNITVEVSKWSGFDETFFKEIIGEGAKFTEDPLEELFQRSDITLITSGTATLQAALAQIPMVVLFKSNPLSVWIYKKIVKGITHIGLPNIIAQKEIVPELIQEELTVQRIFDNVSEYIENKELYKNTITNLKQIKNDLGNITPSERVAEIIVDQIEKRKTDV